MSTRSEILMKEQSAGRFRKPAIGLIVAIVALLIVAGQAFAQDCDTDQDPIVYDSSHGDEPDVATPAWQTMCDGTDGVDFATITDGILTINDNDINNRGHYCRASIFLPNCDPRQDAVYEFSTKVLAVPLPPDSWVPKIAFICGMRDGTDDFRVGVTLDQGVGFFKTTNGVANWLVINGFQQRVVVDWTDAHLFRVEKDDTEVRLFMDNNDLPSVTVALTDSIH